MDSGPAPDPVRARWLIENKRRWPLAVIVAWGWGAALFATLAGAGREAARARLPESRAAVAALEPAAVEEGKNAAPVWLEAIAALEELASRDDGEAFRDDRGDGAPGVGALAREQIERCAGIFELVEQAARLDGCDWGLEYSRFLGLMDSRHPALPSVRRLARLCARRIELAGSENDWERVEKSAGWIFALAGHVEIDPIIVVYLVGVALEGLAINSIESAFEVSTSPPPIETVRRLKAAVRRRFFVAPPLSRILDAERRSFLEILDMLGAGKLGPEFIQAMTGPVDDHPPPALNGYMVIYPLERDFFQEVMGRLISETEAWELGKGSPPVRSEGGSSYHEISRTFFAPLSYFISETMSKTPSMAGKRLARLRSALAALAVLEFRLGRGGAWPESLAQVDLEPEERVDPWSPSREPLRYGILPDGSAAVWSIGEGEDLADEGIDEIDLRFLDGEAIGFRVPVMGGAQDER